MGVVEIRRAHRSRTKLKLKRVGVPRNVEDNEGSHHGEHWLGLLGYMEPGLTQTLSVLLQAVRLDIRPSESARKLLESMSFQQLVDVR